MRHFLGMFALFGMLTAAVTTAQTVSDSSTKTAQEQIEALQKSVDELRSAVQNQQIQINGLMAENKRLKSSPSPAPVQTVVPAAAPAAAQNSLPEIGAVLDIVVNSSENGEDTEGNDRLAARELELVLGYDVDPFTRLDVVLSFSDFEEASLEEAYVTYLGLPKNIHFKGGKFAPRAGKAIAMHRDQLDTVDEPLVIQRYFGAEGMFKSGVEFSRYFPQFAGNLTQELVLGVLEGGAGEGGELFGDTRRRPTYYAHLKNYLDFSDMSNVELGATVLRGSADPDARDEVNALGLDLTLVHYVTPLKKLKWQTELYYQDRRETEVFDRNAALAYAVALNNDVQHVVDNGSALFTGETPNIAVPEFLGALANGPIHTDYGDHPWGLYSVIDYRLSPRFGVGGRFDYVEPVFALSTDPRSADKGFAAYFTYYQSEFARLRLQYEHVKFASGGDDNRFFLQGTYAIGIHKHALK